MDEHALALHSLYLSRFLSRRCKPSKEDLHRLEYGRSLVKRLLAAEKYYSEGIAEGLQTSDVEEVRSVRGALLRDLQNLAQRNIGVRGYLENLDAGLSALIDGDHVSVSSTTLRELRIAFGAIGRAALADAMSEQDQDPIDFAEEDALAV